MKKSRTSFSQYAAFYLSKADFSFLIALSSYQSVEVLTTEQLPIWVRSSSQGEMNRVLRTSHFLLSGVSAGVA